MSHMWFCFGHLYSAFTLLCTLWVSLFFLFARVCSPSQPDFAMFFAVWVCPRCPLCGSLPEPWPASGHADAAGWTICIWPSLARSRWGREGLCTACMVWIKRKTLVQWENACFFSFASQAGNKTRLTHVSPDPLTHGHRPAQIVQMDGLDSVTVVGIAFAAFVIGVLLTAALWYIHTHTGECWMCKGGALKVFLSDKKEKKN